MKSIDHIHYSTSPIALTLVTLSTGASNGDSGKNTAGIRRVEAAFRFFLEFSCVFRKRESGAGQISEEPGQIMFS